MCWLWGGAVASGVYSWLFILCQNSQQCTNRATTAGVRTIESWCNMGRRRAATNPVSRNIHTLDAADAALNDESSGGVNGLLRKAIRLWDSKRCGLVVGSQRFLAASQFAVQSTCGRWCRSFGVLRKRSAGHWIAFFRRAQAALAGGEDFVRAQSPRRVQIKWVCLKLLACFWVLLAMVEGRKPVAARVLCCCCTRSNEGNWVNAHFLW